MKKDFIEELKWRGLLQDLTPQTQNQLNKEITTGYVGFDPTADSLHIGNMVPIMLLVHFQNCGHKPMALVGGATGMVGDPSGKTEERKFLSEEQLIHNQSCIEHQLRKFLNFEDIQNQAKVVNNYDWFKEMGFLEFLRKVGKHITVNYMMSKDSVKRRLETGISFTEFSYQILQGYDFFYLNQQHNVKLQMGGSDQWGNITTGTELIRKISGGEAYALTAPLLTKSDGSKFGKSESGNIWLDAQKTSPYKFFQFWLNTEDTEIAKVNRIFSLKEKDEIEALEQEHLKAPEKRLIQHSLATEMTLRVHGSSALKQAHQASEILFGKTEATFEDLGETTFLEIFEGVACGKLHDVIPTDISEFLSNASENIIFSSKGEARKMIDNGGVSINKKKVSRTDNPQDFDAIFGKYYVVQKGKKNYFLIEKSII
jgi:tyrosyl-tRNA synthetase